MNIASGAIIQDTLRNLWCELKISFTDASGANRAEDHVDASAEVSDTHYETLASEPSDLGFEFQTPASPAPSQGADNIPPASWEVVRSMSDTDADLTTPLVSGQHRRITEDTFTSVAASIGSVILGGALGATAAITTTPFIATGIGAGVLLASFIATTVAIPNDNNERSPASAAAASTGDTAEVTSCETVNAGSSEVGTPVAYLSASMAASFWPSFGGSWPQLAAHWDLSAAAAAAMAAVVAAAGAPALSAPAPAPADLPLEVHPKGTNLRTDEAAADAWGEWWMV
ncbi:hypothetical protein Vretimale_9375 [Volvox reticuliferus]|uniref:Uncharacterized protein n=1 Tax=Volvox reticuliferus TaxID=1737510 RepID=A0A8J4FPS7_9CHLO|nr:hypothetical protein Vretifemale_9897 [Volvox reticuliferus]GIM04879.1 hypothetical protein Vretimale_9375 [Volvox reticuliferus]